MSILGLRKLLFSDRLLGNPLKDDLRINKILNEIKLIQGKYANSQKYHSDELFWLKCELYNLGYLRHMPKSTPKF